MPVPAIITILVGIAASVLAYAGTPHQRLMSHGKPRRKLLWSGLAGLLFVLMLLPQWFNAPAAIFTWLTLMMLTWSTLPLAFAWWRHRERGRP